MPEWLQESVQNTSILSLETLLVRLLLAFALGAVVAGIYRWSHRRNEVPAASFLTTLVLMTIVIAMSTQVIGDNVARAFSLVGALSIVRFRTVVQDTRDTVFVIFTVVVGMAVGAGHIDVAVLGIVITGIASFVMRPQTITSTSDETGLHLIVRVGIGYDPDVIFLPILDKYLSACDLRATATAKQGSAFDLTYRVQLHDNKTQVELVKELGLVEGIQNVELRRPAG